MHRRFLALLTLVLLAAACSGDADDDSADYFSQAAAVTTTYEAAAATHFAEYTEALRPAETEEAAEAAFVDATRSLFANLAGDFEPVVDTLAELTPPESAATEHGQWLEASRALNTLFQDTDAAVAPLEDPGAIDSILVDLPIGDVQAAYRTACEAVAALALEQDEVIACAPPTGST
ncbi:MAG: hypothetical protein KJO17_09055 [Acidimicrobiia bacterium]|nr:hypothetical protein [Acidimicrobiia bacterium]